MQDMSQVIQALGGGYLPSMQALQRTADILQQNNMYQDFAERQALMQAMAGGGVNNRLANSYNAYVNSLLSSPIAAAPVTTPGLFSGIGQGLAAFAGNAAAAIPGAAATIAGLFSDDPNADTSLNSFIKGATEAGQSIADKTSEAYPSLSLFGDRPEDGFSLGWLGQSIGNALGFGISSLVPGAMFGNIAKGMKYGIPAIGSIVETGSLFLEDAKDNGLPNAINNSLLTLGSGTALGLSERLGIGGLLSDVAKKAAGQEGKRWITRAIKAGGKGLIGEFGQEAGQTIGEEITKNLQAGRDPYALSKDQWINVLEAGFAGAAAGSTFGAALGSGRIPTNASGVTSTVPTVTPMGIPAAAPTVDSTKLQQEFLNAFNAPKTEDPSKLQQEFLNAFNAPRVEDPQVKQRFNQYKIDEARVKAATRASELAARRQELSKNLRNQDLQSIRDNSSWAREERRKDAKSELVNRIAERKARYQENIAALKARREAIKAEQDALRLQQQQQALTSPAVEADKNNQLASQVLGVTSRVLDSTNDPRMSWGDNLERFRRGGGQDIQQILGALATQEENARRVAQEEEAKRQSALQQEFRRAMNYARRIDNNATLPTVPTISPMTSLMDAQAASAIEPANLIMKALSTSTDSIQQRRYKNINSALNKARSFINKDFSKASLSELTSADSSLKMQQRMLSIQDPQGVIPEVNAIQEQLSAKEEELRLLRIVAGTPSTKPASTRSRAKATSTKSKKGSSKQKEGGQEARNFQNPDVSPAVPSINQENVEQPNLDKGPLTKEERIEFRRLVKEGQSSLEERKRFEELFERVSAYPRVSRDAYDGGYVSNALLSLAGELQVNTNSNSELGDISFNVAFEPGNVSPQVQRLYDNGFFNQLLERVSKALGVRIRDMKGAGSSIQGMYVSSVDTVNIGVENALTDNIQTSIINIYDTINHEIGHRVTRWLLSKQESVKILQEIQTLISRNESLFKIAQDLRKDYNSDNVLEEVLVRLTANPTTRQALENIVEGRTPTTVSLVDRVVSKISDLWFSLQKWAINQFSMLPVSDNFIKEYAIRVGKRILDIQLSGQERNITSNTAGDIRSYKVISRADRAMLERDKSLLSMEGIKEVYDNLDPDSFKEKFITGYVDALRPVQTFIKELHKEGTVTSTSNIYKLLEVLPNAVSNRLKTAYTTYVAPLETALAEYAKRTNTDNAVVLAQVTDYVEAKAALERNQRYQVLNPTVNPKYIKVGGMSNKDANAVLNKYNQTDMQPFLDLFKNINNYRLQLLEDNNIIPKEVLDQWRDAYQYYMPLKGWEEFVKEVSPEWAKSKTRRAISTPTVQKQIAARVSGRTQQADDPVTNAIKQLYDVVDLVYKVDTVQRGLLQLAEDNPDSTVFSIVKEGRAALNNARTIKFNALDGTIEFPYKKHDAKDLANTIACIGKDGKLYRVEFVDPKIAQAINGENVTVVGQVLQTVGAIQRVLAGLMTSKSPIFWTVNPVRDFFTASINIQSLKHELRNLGVPDSVDIAAKLLERGRESFITLFTNKASDQIKGVRAALQYYYRTGDISLKDVHPDTKKYMKDIASFMEYGGQTAYFSDTNTKLIKKTILQAMKEKNPQTKAEYGQKILNSLGTWMNEVSDSLENMTRYVVFQEIVDAIRTATLVSGTLNTYRKSNGQSLTEHEILSRAANAALNITVNFTKRGAYAPIFGNLFIFSSASIAGNYRMLETILHSGKNGRVDWNSALKFVAMPTALYFVLSSMAQGLMDTDDDGVNAYDKIPDYVKNNNIILPSPLGGKDYIAIPLPYGFNIFWTMGRNIVDSIRSFANKTPGPSFGDAGWSIVSSFFDNFSAIGQPSEGMNMFIPSIIRPLFQLYTNKAFTGNPIMPEGTVAFKGVDKPDSYRYWDTANRVVVDLCKAINSLTGGNEVKSGLIDVSPETLEHLQTSYLGGMGKLFFGTLGKFTGLLEGKDLDKEFFSGLPFVKPFYKQIQPGDTSALFARYRSQVQTAINETELARTDRNIPFDERLDMIENNKDLYRLKGTLNSLQDKLNELEHKKKLIGKRNLSYEVIYKQEEAINERKQAIMKQFIRKAGPLIHSR